MATFRKIKLEIRRTSLYGRYVINAKYKGRDVIAFTNDSECFDWLNDTSNKEKHLQAKRHAYGKIVEQYKQG